MFEELQQLKGKEYIGVKELAYATENLLRRSGPNQEKTKGTVTEYPNERTIRFYIAERLLPEAIEKQGNTSVYGYIHLLTLVVIKKLQADRLPINIIGEVLEGKTEAELEKILGEPVRVKFIDDQEEIRHLRTRSDTELTELHGETFQKIEDPNAMAEYLKPRRANAAKEYLEGLLFSRSTDSTRHEGPQFSVAEEDRISSFAPQAFSRTIAHRRTPPTDSEVWNRFEIEPGLELHVRESYKPPSDRREGSKLISRIKDILGIDKRS